MYILYVCTNRVTPKYLRRAGVSPNLNTNYHHHQLWTDLQSGQLAALFSQAVRQSEWNWCWQGRRRTSSSCSNLFRQIGHSASLSSLTSLRGRD